MGAIKIPDIESLDSGSLCHSLYRELYNQFFNAQDRKDAEHPWGVEEGDDTSVRLHNTAYGFAVAIAGAVEGGGSSGTEGILLDYLKKSGGDMSGMLRANYGIEAGIANKTLLSAYNSDEDAGIRFPESIDIWGSVFMKGAQVMAFDRDRATLTLTVADVDMGAGNFRTNGDVVVGYPDDNWVSIKPGRIRVSGKDVYHEGTANLETVDWRMKDATVAGALSVAGAVSLSGKLIALHGVELGSDGRGLLYLDDGMINARSDLSFASGYGIRISDKLVLGRVNESDIRLSSVGGGLLLGGADTSKIKLLSFLMDEDGEYTLLSPHGAAYFPDSLTVRHNFGDVLFSTYRADSANEGVVIPKLLRFLSTNGPSLSGTDTGITLETSELIQNPADSTWYNQSARSTFTHGLSTSHLAPTNKVSYSFIIGTDTDFVRVDKPLEAKNHIGIDSSYTRLTDGALYFTEANYLLSAADGIKHNGNTYILGDISSELFSSGLAGSGWAIQKNKTTGNTAATFDELTVRKRMRVYELEIQKTSATNGSLWISDSFSGDTVEMIQ